MGYLLTEIVVYLVIAGLIGFLFGWLVRDGALDKYFSKTKENIKEVEVTKEENQIEKPIKEESKTETEETKKEVASKKEIKVVKEEVQSEKETKENTVEVESITVDAEDKPTLLTEIPKSGADKLSTIKGIGPVLEKKLNELGVYTFEQIASWSTEEAVWIGSQMAFPKRVTKEEWVKQAKELLKAK